MLLHCPTNLTGPPAGSIEEAYIFKGYFAISSHKLYGGRLILPAIAAPDATADGLHDLTGRDELPMFAASRMAEFVGIRAKNRLQQIGIQ
jgi:hypothetical protein